MYGVNAAVGVDDGATPWVLARDRQEAVAQAVVELYRHLLVTVLVAGARGGALQALLDREVQD